MQQRTELMDWKTEYWKSVKWNRTKKKTKIKKQFLMRQFKRPLVQHQELQESQMKRERAQNLFEEIIAEKFPNPEKKIDIYVQNAQRVQNKMKSIKKIQP